jgi:hypothetical protein
MYTSRYLSQFMIKSIFNPIKYATSLLCLDLLRTKVIGLSKPFPAVNPAAPPPAARISMSVSRNASPFYSSHGRNSEEWRNTRGREKGERPARRSHNKGAFAAGRRGDRLGWLPSLDVPQSSTSSASARLRLRSPFLLWPAQPSPSPPHTRYHDRSFHLVVLCRRARPARARINRSFRLLLPFVRSRLALPHGSSY